MTDHMTPYTKLQPKRKNPPKKNAPSPSQSEPLSSRVLGAVFYPLLWIVCKLGGGKGAWKA